MEEEPSPATEPVAATAGARRAWLPVTALVALVLVAVAVVLLVSRDDDPSVDTMAGPAATTTLTAPPAVASPPASAVEPTATTPAPTAAAPSTTAVVPTTPLAPDPEPTTPPAPTIPAGPPVDCGTAFHASGWPTTTAPSPRQTACISYAFATGAPAVYVERDQTDGEGGHIAITTYEVIGVGLVRVTTDLTGALPPGGVEVRECTGLDGSTGIVEVSGCTTV